MTKRIHSSEPVDISTDDHVFQLAISAIYVGAGGTVVARLRGDSEDSEWVGVQSNSYLLGDFTHVRQAGTDASQMIGVTDR